METQVQPSLDLVDRINKARTEHVVGSFRISQATKPSTIVFQGDGVWEIRKNQIGTFVSQIAEVAIPGLAKDLFEGIYLDVNQISKESLFQIITFFKDIAERMHNAEALVYGYYHLTTKTWLLDVPKQQVSGGGVKAEPSPELERASSGYIRVFDIHSHNSMPAFFSGTDNKDEAGDKIYLVVGKIDDKVPQINIRGGGRNKRIKLSLNMLFDITNNEYEKLSEIPLVSYPAEWVEKVQELFHKEVVLSEELSFHPPGTTWWETWQGQMERNYIRDHGISDAETQELFDEQVYVFQNGQTDEGALQLIDETIEQEELISETFERREDPLNDLNLVAANIDFDGDEEQEEMMEVFDDIAENASLMVVDMLVTKICEAGKSKTVINAVEKHLGITYEQPKEANKTLLTKEL